MGDFTVQISNDLVDRLLDNDEKLKSRTKRKLKPRLPKGPQHPQSQVNKKQPYDDFEALKGTSGLPIQPPCFLPISPPAHSANAELDAIRSVLKRARASSRGCISRRRTFLDEMTERARELQEEFKLPYQKPMPCQAKNNASMECY